MNVEIFQSRYELRLIASLKLNAKDQATLDHVIMMSDEIWYGKIEGELACIWGVIPPTILSNQAYVWFLNTELMSEHKFVLVRNSQIWMQDLLKRYDTVVGHCHKDNPLSIKWIRWLGGTFTDNGEKMNFTIRGDHGPVYANCG